MQRFRTYAAIAALLALTSSGQSVAAPADPNVAVETIATAVQKARAEETAQVAIRGQLDGGLITLEGGLILRTAEADFNMVIKGSGLLGHGGFFTGDLRAIDGQVYLQMPAMRITEGGRAWNHVSFTGASGHTSPLSSVTVGTLALDRLRMCSDPAAVGYDQIRGMKTTHYEAGVLEPDTGGSVAMRRMTPIDAWISNDGRLVRVAVHRTLPDGVALPAGMSRESRVVVDFLDWGVPVEVEHPPADEVQELNALTGATA